MIYIANYNNIRKKQYQSFNATECTIFFVIPSFANTSWMVREHATIIIRVKNMMCSNLSHRQQTSYGLETY
jgi:hypothetical protein